MDEEDVFSGDIETPKPTHQDSLRKVEDYLKKTVINPLFDSDEFLNLSVVRRGYSVEINQTIGSNDKVNGHCSRSHEIRINTPDAETAQKVMNRFLGAVCVTAQCEEGTRPNPFTGGKSGVINIGDSDDDTHVSLGLVME